MTRTTFRANSKAWGTNQAAKIAADTTVGLK